MSNGALIGGLFCAAFGFWFGHLMEPENPDDPFRIAKGIVGMGVFGLAGTLYGAMLGETVQFLMK